MVHIPAPMEVRVLLEDLLGRTVDVSLSAPWAPVGDEAGTIAVYVDDTLAIRSVVVADLPLSAYVGGALGLIPSGRVQELVECDQIDENIAENLDEVFNICAGLQNVTGHPHMRLHRVHHVFAEVEPQIQALAAVLGQRLDLNVQVAGYGAGRLSFVGVA